MNGVDASDHYDVSDTERAPSLLTIVVDTNPRAWAAIGNELPVSKAIANILLFVNAHLAFNDANQVAIIASHCHQAVWLYPAPPTPSNASKDASGDVVMSDDAAPPSKPPTSANKQSQFSEIETSLLKSLRDLISSTAEEDLVATKTQISGALTLALAYINKVSLSLATASKPEEAQPAQSSTGGMVGLTARILVLSVSDSEPTQYIPTMNAVFAASHHGIPIDVLSLHGAPTFLQQASYITRGTFLPARAPQGLIGYLMWAFVPDAGARADTFVAPAHDRVDFRAACFCHGRVVDTGFVCSICLSIFCEVPDGAVCLTCGEKLALGTYGAKPAVVPRKKKKRRRVVNGEAREESGSVAGTPRPGGL